MSWQPDPLVAGPLLALGALYARGARAMAHGHRLSATARRRAWAFWAGYAALLVALLSPLHHAADETFTAHMVQHLLLTMVAAPLLLVGSAMPALLWAFSTRSRSMLARQTRPSAPLPRTLRALTHPLVAWTTFVVCQWLWHQPAAYEAAVANRWVHYAQHLTFFGTALLFWWPVIGAPPLGSPLSYPARMLYTFLAWLPNSVLGAGFTLTTTVQYPHYAEQARRAGADPLSDQVLAGLIMWVPGDLLFLVILLALLAAYLRQEERRAERLDRELDALDAAARSRPVG